MCFLGRFRCCRKNNADADGNQPIEIELQTNERRKQRDNNPSPSQPQVRDFADPQIRNNTSPSQPQVRDFADFNPQVRDYTSPSQPQVRDFANFNPQVRDYKSVTSRVTDFTNIPRVTDSSNITPMEEVQRVIKEADKRSVPMQHTDDGEIRPARPLTPVDFLVEDREIPGLAHQYTTSPNPLPTPGKPSPQVHDWQIVPDTAGLPPPPVQAFLYSNTGNAPVEEAEAAHDFCDRVPLKPPVKPSPSDYQAAQKVGFKPIKPRTYIGSLFSCDGNWRWKGVTVEGARDSILWTDKPMYYALEDSPLITERRKTIYFEIKLNGLFDKSSPETPGFSIGYIALPYPSWRAPGWERGSLAVFSDDGCRYINDSFGGKQFTTQFRLGETVGLGMTFYPVGEEPSVASPQPPAYGNARPFAVEVFFTRDGRLEGKWNLHEERDADHGDVAGLEGNYDLHGAIGVFGGVEFEAVFNRSGWKWSPDTEMGL